MSKVFTIGIRKSASVSILVFVAALTVGVWLLFGDPAASSAAPTFSNGVDIGQVAAKLEQMHQRTAARQASEDDDKSETSSSSVHAVTPEQAAMLAQQHARGRGDATTKHSYIELQTRNGRPVYAVRIGTRSVFIDADNGAAGD
jgi:uncharacterized membrane protein YkoI